MVSWKISKFARTPCCVGIVYDVIILIIKSSVKILILLLTSGKSKMYIRPSKSHEGIQHTGAIQT